MEVVDDGEGPACLRGEAVQHIGHGITGLTERAERLRGRIEAGGLPDGRGFRLAVSIPVSAAAGSMIRVLIAEDQGMVRGALASLLGLEPDIEVVAQVARGDEVLAAALDVTPDVALLDIEMPGATGLDAAEQLAVALPVVPGPDPDHLRAAGLPAPGDGGRGLGLRAQGRPRGGAGLGDPPRAARASGSSTRGWPRRRCHRASRR